MVHPVQSVIESLYAAGRCPRLHVNALFDGVVCPDFIREQWQERLIIDLDATYPLDLTFEKEHLSADLSFGGYVTRCTFPWGAVYVVADRSTGRGIVLDQNMPESVKRSRYAKTGQGPPPTRPELRSVGDDDPTPDVAPAEAVDRDDQAPDDDIHGEDEAQKRRAAFKVINGGD
jgi:stringent starvation protein B